MRLYGGAIYLETIEIAVELSSSVADITLQAHHKLTVTLTAYVHYVTNLH